MTKIAKWLGPGALLVVALACAVAAPPPPRFVLDGEFDSDTQNTTVRVYKDPSDPFSQGGVQGRVFGEGISDPDGYLLWEGGNRASAELTSDGEGIAINN